MEENTNLQHVVDASFVLSYILPDENSDLTDKLFEKYYQGEITFISTFLLPFEVLNSLKTSVTRKRLSKKTAFLLAKQFLKYKISLYGIDFFQALLLSQKENITFYDASYLYLAKSHNIPLLTLDRALSRFAEKK